MVEVFRTSVSSQASASALLSELYEAFPGYRINFDLEDCDRILRVQSPAGEIRSEAFISLLDRAGYNCAVLEE